MQVPNEMIARAKSGNTRAMYTLAKHYDFVVCNVAGSRREAFRWYLAAAKKGHYLAQGYVGFMLSEGDGVRKNAVEAVKWFRIAAHAGDADSMLCLGYHLFYGEGVRKDRKAAVRWYRRAAKKRNPDAYFNLALCYYEGDVVRQDYALAARLWKKAERHRAYSSRRRAQNYLADIYEHGLGVQKSERWSRYWREKAEGIRDLRGKLKTPEYYRKQNAILRSIANKAKR